MPATFQIDAAEYLADESFVFMSLAARGAYFTLILQCWCNGTIPSDMGRLGRLCGLDSSAMAQLMAELDSKFISYPEQPDRLVHLGLERERIRQQERGNERAESGRKGAISRWEKVQVESTEALTANAPNEPDSQSADSPAIAQPLAKPEDEPCLAIENGETVPTTKSINTLSKRKRVVVEKGGVGGKTNSRKPTNCDEVFLAELQKNPAYQFLDVQRIYAKMCVWCQQRNKQATRLRLIGWLNREDPPMNVQGQNHLNGASPDTKPLPDYLRSVYGLNR